MVEEGQVRLIGVRRRGDVRLGRRAATSAVRLHWSGPRDTEDHLGVKVTLLVHAFSNDTADVGSLVVLGVIDDLELELVGGLGSLWTEGRKELVRIIAAVGLVEIVVDGDGVLVGSLDLVVYGTVESPETFNGGEADIANRRNLSCMVIAFARLRAILMLASVLPPELR